MNLIKVDVVGLKAAQGRLYGLGDPTPGITLLVGVIAHRAMHLGGQHDLVAAPFKRFADDLFGLALAVTIRRVDEVDAEVERLVDDADAVVVVGVGETAEHHRA